jgi:hypothetical protein
MDGKWGYINAAGRIVVEPQYSYAYSFSDGLAQVWLGEQGEKRYFINKDGDVVFTPPEVGFVSEFHEGLAPYLIRFKYGYIDKQGQVVIPLQFDRVDACEPGGYGVVGHFCLDVAFGIFSEGLAPFPKGDTKKVGYVDKAGRIAIEPIFEDGYEFSEGLGLVKSGEKWGFIDRSGKFVIEPKFDSGVSFREGLAAIQLGEKWGFINKSGEIVIEPQYDDANYFSEGLAPVAVGCEDQQRWGYIDRSGNMVISPRFEWAYSFDGGLARVSVSEDDTESVSGQYGGYINTRGEYIKKPSMKQHSK